MDFPIQRPVHKPARLSAIRCCYLHTVNSEMAHVKSLMCQDDCILGSSLCQTFSQSRREGQTDSGALRTVALALRGDDTSASDRTMHHSNTPRSTVSTLYSVEGEALKLTRGNALCGG